MTGPANFGRPSGNDRRAIDARLDALESRMRQIPSRFVAPASGDVATIKKQFTQTAHGFTAGTVVYFDDATNAWAKSIAVSNDVAFEITGVVETSDSADTFTVVFAGVITLSSMTVGQVYYLSGSSAGAVTTTPPSTAAANVTRAVYQAISATVAIVFHSQQQPKDLVLQYATGKHIKAFANSGKLRIQTNENATATIDIDKDLIVTISYGSGKTIIFDPADYTAGAAAAGTLKMREVDCCVAGAAKKRLILCTPTY